LEALLTSTLSVSIAEIGDKTQLLALLLTCRFRKPAPIILGIFLATVLNHAIAAWVGDWASGLVAPELARALVAGSFILMALWVLVPDKLEEEDSRMLSYGPLLATLVLFFLAEIGDKTQVATVLLAAKYDSLLWVITGTTLGMLAANVPVVIAGQCGASKLPLKAIRYATAALFVVVGISTLLWQ